MSIYDKHDAAFRGISAAVIVQNGERVGTVAFKRARSGGVTAFVHWHGEPMVSGHAGGYGYDKQTAACADAARRMPAGTDSEAFREALMVDDGRHWYTALEAAGFNVWWAI